MRLKLLLAALLAAAPVPAFAQVTATYAFGKQEVKIEAAANGDYRVDIGPARLIRVEGVEYLAMPGKDGTVHVTKFRDMLAIVEAQMKKMPGVTPPAPPEGAEGESPLAPAEDGEGEAAVAGQEDEAAIEADGAGEDAEAVEGEADAVPFKMPPMLLNYKLTPGAEEIVGGFTGTAWTFEVDFGAMGADGEAPKSDKTSKVFVMSKDPRLAPLAPPFKLGIEMISKFVAPIFGPDSNFTAKIAELMEQGVPVRIAEDVKLAGVATAPIDPARFELPGAVIQAADFMTLTGGGGGAGAMPPLP
jgi:hypothetical protein